MADTALMGALLAVQGEAPSLQRDKINPAFKSKYLSLEKLMEQVLPVLNKHGLVWITLPGIVEGQPVLRYRLICTTPRIEAVDSEGRAMGCPSWADVIEGTMPLLLTKNDSQGLGSAITYARRYALMAVLGLVADEDDDGNAASGTRSSRGSSQSRRAPAAKAATASSPGSYVASYAEQRALRDLIKAGSPSEADVRLMLTTAGVSADGTVAAAIKGLTKDQATQMRELLSRNDASKEG